jgi:hypothetical protein
MYGRMILVGAALFVTLVAGWIFRYENTKQSGVHRNRITNAFCYAKDECWLTSDIRLK